MQLLTRCICMNLTRNAIQMQAKVAFPAAILHKRTELLAQNYATKRKQKLMRYPAFPLEETLTKFLKSTEPLLSEEELKETKEATEDFQQDEGKILQELLVKVAAEEENWLASRWLRGAYLRYRDPVTIFSSPGMTFPLRKFETSDDFFCYAGKLIFGMIMYKQIIDEGGIPIVKMGKYELDNSQFGKVFGTCRLPKKGEDILEFHPNSKHIVVIYKNHFYKFPVYNKSGKPLHPDVLTSELQRICKSVTEPGVPIGILSTDTRDNWAKSFDELMKSFGNVCGMRVIQKALFTVSLDECVPVGKDQEYVVLSEQLIHGGGPYQNASNRWMDKTIQLIINRNGMSGFTYEHSPAEGQPIAAMSDCVMLNLDNEEDFAAAAHEDFEAARKLTINSSPIIDKYIDMAKENLNCLVRDLHINVLHYEAHGTDFPKSQKLSPDSYLQIAMQFAFYRLHKTPAAHYESAHLRAFVGGRTETIRSCSNESIAFADAMICKEKDMTDARRVELLVTAVKAHRAYTQMALLGGGVDRHLFGLKEMARENKCDVPDFYKSPGFVKSSHFRLSTSQVASKNLTFMCYGPLTTDGYGCCYNPRKTDIMFAVSAWRKDPETSADLFALALKEALDAMCELLSRCKL